MTTETYDNFCDFLKQTIQGTNWEGHVFAVGGCCRDKIMGHPIKDVDLAVDLPNGGIKFVKWLEKKHRLTGRPIFFKRFGTAKFTMRRFPDLEIEAVQTRRAKYDADTEKNPEKAFGSIVDDALRRDLTINSLFYDISRGQILDPTGKAVEDIAEKRLRTPLDALSTFDDDPIRILRTVRFAMRYGHEIDASTLTAMTEIAPKLDLISRERIRNEFEKILCGPNPVKAISILSKVGAMGRILPELEIMRNFADFDGQDLLVHSLKTLDEAARHEVDSELTAAFRWAALLHDIGKPSTKITTDSQTVDYPNHESAGARIARQTLRRLRYEQQTVRDVMLLISQHGIARNRGRLAEKVKDRQLRRLQLQCGDKKRFDATLALIDCDARSHIGPHRNEDLYTALVQRSQQLKSEGTTFDILSAPMSRIELSEYMRNKSDVEIDIAYAKLLKAACSNPNRTKEEFLAIIGVKQAPDESTNHASEKPTRATQRRARKRGQSTGSCKRRRRRGKREAAS